MIFEKGLGELQRSARTPGHFRANVVKFGSNNSIVGQAELEKLNPLGQYKFSEENVMLIYDQGF